MNVQRGDVVLVDFPYAAGTGAKVRPALVIQNDNDNRRLANTIVVQITGVTRLAADPTKVLIDLSTPEGKASGLKYDSLVNCVNILTLDKRKVLQKLGSLPSGLMQRVGDSVKLVLDLT